jgi:hypothetical protein
MALALSLAVVAFVLLLSLRVALSRFAGIAINDLSIRIIKGQSAVVSLNLRPKGQPRDFQILEVVPSKGVMGEIESTSNQELRIKVSSNYAGVFPGLTLGLGLVGRLGLFFGRLDISLENFSVYSLPVALLAPPERVALTAFTLGERPVGVRGRSQEVYSIQESSGILESKSIHWKQVSRSPEDKVFVKIRDSSVPTPVKIGVLDFGDEQEEGLAWMDLASEGVAKVGMALQQMGSAVTLCYSTPGGLIRSTASNTAELSDALIGLWESQRNLAHIVEIIGESDILVLAQKHLHRSFENYRLGKPVLAVSASPSQQLPGFHVFPFSGHESIDSLLMATMSG